MQHQSVVLISVSLVFSQQWDCTWHYGWQTTPLHNLLLPPWLLHRYQIIHGCEQFA